MARSGATVVNQADGSGVGDVRYSMLTEAEFQAQNGTNWVLMDGRNVAGSKYATLKATSTIPDHRGQSPRAKNNGRADGSQDPGGERALGNLQSHATAKNGLALSDPGHQHQTTGNTGSDQTGWGLSTNAAFAYSSFSGTVSTAARTSPVGTSVSLGTGDAETRMRNIALNAFIKIN